MKVLLSRILRRFALKRKGANGGFYAGDNSGCCTKSGLRNLRLQARRPVRRVLLFSKKEMNQNTSNWARKRKKEKDMMIRLVNVLCGVDRIGEL